LKDNELEYKVLSGGASGQVVSKVSCKKGGIHPSVVMFKQGDKGVDGKPALAGSALATFGSASGDNNFCGNVYLGGNMEYDGMQVSEFALGGATVPSGASSSVLFENLEDAKSWGHCLGQLHSYDTAWYDKGGYQHNCFRFRDTDDERRATQKQFDKAISGDIAKSDEWGMQLAELYYTLTAAGVKWQNSEALTWGEAAAKIIHQRLVDMRGDGNGLMDRLVICHGDAHGGNFTHKTEGGHGDLMVIDFDLMRKAPAWFDMGTMLAAWQPETHYPSLESRRAAAQAYLDTVGEIANDFERNTVDDIVFDMEKGVVCRITWLSIIVPLIYQIPAEQPRFNTYCMLTAAANGAKLLAKAGSDAELKQEIMEKGIIQVATKGYKISTGMLLLPESFFKGQKQREDNARRHSSIPLGPVANPVERGCCVLQ